MKTTIIAIVIEITFNVIVIVIEHAESNRNHNRLHLCCNCLMSGLESESTRKNFRWLWFDSD